MYTRWLIVYYIVITDHLHDSLAVSDVILMNSYNAISYLNITLIEAILRKHIHLNNITYTMYIV